MPRSLILIAVAALSGCGSDPAGEAADETAPTETAARADTAAEVEATVAGIEAGDHLWARFEPAGGSEAEPAALVTDMAIAAFLEAHRGRLVNLRIASENRLLDPPGERMDVRTVTAARMGALTAQGWWGTLTAAQKEAAERGVWQSERAD